MSVTPERRAELEAELDELLGAPPLPKPKLVTNDGAVVRDADVHVSPADRRNSRYGTVDVVSVRRPEPEWLRPDRVTINMAEAERQWHERQHAEAAALRGRKEADPFGLGHWGASPDER